MRIARADVRPFTVPMRWPLATRAGTITTRRGLLVRLEDATGRVGLGEASPADWLGPEDVDVARRALAALPALIGAPLAGRDVLATVVAMSQTRSPAAACAIETAWLDLEGRMRDTSVAALLGGGRRRLPVSALLAAPSPVALAETVRQLVRDGWGTVKLKVGVRTLDEDRARVAAVRAAGGDGLAIRLDANRAWGPAAAREALRALRPFAPALIEEPLAAGTPAATWRTLRTDFEVPLAGDESITDLATLEAIAGAIDAIVLKPTRLGGPTATLALAREAHRRGLATIVTDSIETAVGRALATHVAAALPGEPAAIGLGGAVVLAADPLGPMPRPAPWVDVTGPGLGL